MGEMETSAKPAFLSRSPWQILDRGFGGYKYLVFLPFLIKALQGIMYGERSSDNWCLHMLVASSLRWLVGQLWSTFSRLHCLAKKYEINTRGVEFEQVDREFHSDDYVLLDVLMLTAARVFMPGLRQLPGWDVRGLVFVALLHVGPIELVYYFVHRAMHSSKYFFKNYHSIHHLSVNTESSTSGVSSFLEEIMYSVLLSTPILICTALQGGASLSMIYLYWLTTDNFKKMAHCNIEFIPAGLFRALPILRYFVITPSYHSLHHTEMNSNYCLFLPLYDHLGNTVSPKTEELHTQLRKGHEDVLPNFVFLAHCIDVASSLHVSFVFRTLASYPYAAKWWMWPELPFVVIAIILMWIWGNVFVAYKYVLNGMSCQTWVVPRYGFHYFIPGRNKINDLIEGAILDADRLGAKVISLGALNKNEALNGGGKLFVDRNPNLRIRVAHGNTLTAGCIINAIPKDVTEVFMTGATSKLGRGIALYLCRKRVRVLMLTQSQERYDAIVAEAAPELRQYLVRVTKYQAGKNCKSWIMGKGIVNADQQWAPAGTFFHQFVVPPVPEIRKDCTYGKLAAMRLPKQVKGISTCEVWCDRSVVHACHGGGLIHALEGWTHHEVGGIDVDFIDTVWDAAMKHGFEMEA